MTQCFLDGLKHGWVLPPTSEAVSDQFAQQVDGYVALEVMNNTLGMQDIQVQLVTLCSAGGRPEFEILYA